jgi:salicylate hydroxylase
LSDARIAIVGAGIGGLVAGLALTARGFTVDVYEQAPALGEVGAGLTLSRGAQSVFRELGVMERIAPLAVAAGRFAFLHYRSAALLAGAMDPSDGAPDDGTADVARQIHRADLHSVLADAFRERAPGRLHLGHALVAIDDRANAVDARFANGAVASADALIAADGVRSTARTLLWGEDQPRYTGQVAFRFLVARAAAQPYLEHGRGAVFIGPGRTFNRYTLRGGAMVNCVGLAAHPEWVADSWSCGATREELLANFEGWHPSVTGLMGEAGALIKWGIYDRAPLPCWSQGRSTLLGDAAHAMLPFLGMGAAMAIEDGMILARAFDTEGGVAEAFARYEASRRPRTTLVHEKSAQQGRLTQALDPEAYDHSASPAGDPAITGFDPVTAPI